MGHARLWLSTVFVAIFKWVGLIVCRSGSLLLVGHLSPSLVLAASRETKGECEKNREQSIIDVVVVVGRKSCALVWPGALRGAERGECGDPREALGQAHSFKQATRADHLAVVVLIGVVLCCAAVWCGVVGLSASIFF